MTRLRKTLSPLRLAVAGVGLLLFAFLLLWLLPSNEYIFLPDRAHPVGPLVTVQGGRAPKDGGAIYFVDIFVRKATLIERLWPGIHEGAQLVPASDVLPKGVNETQRVQADQREMTHSQQLAAAVALRAAGYHVIARPTGVLVEQVAGNAPAAGLLQPTDVIVAADGKRVLVPADLRRIVGAKTAGSIIRLTIRRGAQQELLDVKTVADPSQRGRSIIGIIVSQAAFIKLPLTVKINAGNVGGPSAGLAFALDILEQLGHDVDHGQKIAATGQIELDGSITPIGGVEQKTIGVRRAGVHVFLVPAGDNAVEARRYAGGVRIVAVHSFQQALRALATLAKKR
ncbi:MAG: S16 family serine protease [Gaiellaceae bacterium]